MKLHFLFLSFIFWITLFAYSPQRARAQEVLFEDDFSNGLTKWQPTRDNGSMWSIVDGKAYVDVQRYYYVTEMIPKDQYWNNNWHNIEYELDFTPLEGV